MHSAVGPHSFPRVNADRGQPVADESGVRRVVDVLTTEGADDDVVLAAAQALASLLLNGTGVPWPASVKLFVAPSA